MDLNKSLRLAIDTGDVKLGCNETSKSIENGKAKLVILSSNQGYLQHCIFATSSFNAKTQHIIH